MDYRLSVDRQHLLQGLRIFKKAPRKAQQRDRAILGFDGRYLTVEAHDKVFLAHAVGAWPGNASVSATLVHALVDNLPAGDPLIVTCDGEHVTFGPVKVGCRWQPLSSSLLEVPARREWIESLALKYTLPRGRIIAEGLGSEVAAAERKLDALIRRAAKSLAPFGVTTVDVQDLVERRLQERSLARR
jgi:hypothetical protein